MNDTHYNEQSAKLSATFEAIEERRKATAEAMHEAKEFGERLKAKHNAMLKRERALIEAQKELRLREISINEEHKKVKLLEKELDGVIEKKNKVYEELQQKLFDEINDFMTKKGVLEDQILNATKELDISQKKEIKLKEKVNKLTADNNSLKVTVTVLTKEKEDLQKENSTLTENYSSVVLEFERYAEEQFAQMEKIRGSFAEPVLEGLAEVFVEPTETVIDDVLETEECVDNQHVLLGAESSKALENVRNELAQGNKEIEMLADFIKNNLQKVLITSDVNEMKATDEPEQVINDREELTTLEAMTDVESLNDMEEPSVISDSPADEEESQVNKVVADEKKSAHTVLKRDLVNEVQRLGFAIEEKHEDLLHARNDNMGYQFIFTNEPHIKVTAKTTGKGISYNKRIKQAIQSHKNMMFTMEDDLGHITYPINLSHNASKVLKNALQVGEILKT